MLSVGLPLLLLPRLLLLLSVCCASKQCIHTQRGSAAIRREETGRAPGSMPRPGDEQELKSSSARTKQSKARGPRLGSTSSSLRVLSLLLDRDSMSSTWDPVRISSWYKNGTMESLTSSSADRIGILRQCQRCCERPLCLEKILKVGGTRRGHGGDGEQEVPLRAVPHQEGPLRRVLEDLLSLGRRQTAPVPAWKPGTGNTAMESTESRFAHLLQPIRELAKNWDVDVASELNDYLEELDAMCITFDGGSIQLNFAEAALLVQGSTCIYSKKVELLHNLVYQTLEYINNKNKNQERNKQSSESQDVDSAVSHGDDDDVDVFTVMDSETSTYSLKPEGKTPVEVVRLPPDALVNPGSFEKNKFPMISVKGDVFCSLKDFKMNLFFPGDKGQIYLTYGSRDEDLYLDVNRILDFDRDQRQQEEAVLAPPTGDATVDMAGDGGHDDNDFVPLNDVMDTDQDAEEHVERHQAQSDGPMIRERRQVQTAKRTEETPPAVNVWALHDPYAYFGEEKPLKTGKSYKVPDGLDDKGKRKRKRASALQDFRTWFTGTFDPPEHKLKHGPTFTDLNYIFVSTMKEKLKSQRRIFRRAGVAVSDEELKKTLLQPEEEGPRREGEEPVDEFRHADLLLGGGDDDNSDCEQDAFPDDVPAEFGGGDDISPDANKDDLSYEDLVRLRIEQLVVNCQGYTQETDLSRRVREWEDMIRPELAMQEERPIFDIHDYGDRIVAALGSVGSRKDFSSIVHGLDNFEACKYMLASLQLANDYTVDVDCAEGLEDSVDSMGLTLLSLHRAADRFNQDGFGTTTA